jgi:uncharacterized membrane protein YjjP (DUF1212 family)
MEAAILFNVVVVMGFLGSVVNYYLIGKSRMNRLVFLFTLACFVVSEALVALHYPIYWLYVALNLWGIWNLWGRKNEER